MREPSPSTHYIPGAGLALSALGDGRDAGANRGAEQRRPLQAVTKCFLTFVFPSVLQRGDLHRKLFRVERRAENLSVIVLTLAQVDDSSEIVFHSGADDDFPYCLRRKSE